MKVQYTNDSLVITIPSQCPAALHAQLMKSISSTMIHTAGSAEKTKDFQDEVTPLLELLKTIIPTERELSKAYE